MDLYAFAISSHIVAKDKFLDLASFRAAQTIEIRSQHPQTHYQVGSKCKNKKVNIILLNIANLTSNSELYKSYIHCILYLDQNFFAFRQKSFVFRQTIIFCKINRQLPNK